MHARQVQRGGFADKPSAHFYPAFPATDTQPLKE